MILMTTKMIVNGVEAETEVLAAVIGEADPVGRRDPVHPTANGSQETVRETGETGDIGATATVALLCGSTVVCC